MTTRNRGLLLALAAAAISGVSVFVNGYGVKQYPDATAYTTAKNAVAALIVVVAAVAAARRRAAGRGAAAATAAVAPTAPEASPAARRLGLVVVAVVGGSTAFVLFFEGLARSSAKDAAFIHKTLVVWVAVLGATILRERVGALHVAAVAVLVSGQALLGVRLGAIGVGSGEAMILAATVLWAVEVVVAKRLLASVPPTTVAVARMGGGALLLLGLLAVRGDLGHLVPTDRGALVWVGVTGALLGAYVLTWFHALAAAPAVDVTALLVAGAVVTALLDAAVKGAALGPLAGGLALIVAGTAVALRAARPTSAPRVPRTTAPSAAGATAP